jgi:sortase A
MNRMRAAGFLLIAIGAIMVITAGIMHFTAKQKGDELVKIYMDYADSIPDEETEEESEPVSESEVSTVSENVQPTTLREGVLGVMVIDKISLTAPIAEGTDNKSIRYALGHFKGTAMPGAVGNFAIAGHRSYTFGEYFSRLDELEAGDMIKVMYKGNTFNYVVDDSFVVKPSEVEVLDQTEDATITLVTCTPKWTGTHRLIVKGHLVNTELDMSEE